MGFRSAAILAVGLIVAGMGGVVLGAGTEPDFGPNVLVFDPSMKDVQKRMDEVFKQQESAQFGKGRFCYLFKPGKYDVDVQVGFYMEVMGLGETPDEVEIRGAVRSMATWFRGNATCNFWRAAENLAVVPALENKVNVWAVSQGVSMRRMHIKGDMNLWDGGWSSGGFLADSRIDGVLNSGSQQQWLSRNDEWGEWRGGSWNMVFVGDKGAPSEDWPRRPYTVVEKTPVEREKPYLCVDKEDRYFVVVPGLSGGTSGVTWGRGASAGSQAVPIEAFYIAHAERDTAGSINAALLSGKNLLLTPGIYHVDAPIQVGRAGTVVLGLGYPTLTAEKGTAAMEVADVDGVKVGGILFEAGAMESRTLLQVGSPIVTKRASHAADPLFLWDIFARAGGASAGQTAAFVEIDANNVVGDNFWLWRADHGRGAGWNSNRNANGLVVNGDDVIMYGLFVEHSQEYQTLWNGNGGRVYFYQSELPYDPPNQEAWWHKSARGNVRGWASYKVADSVTSHEAWGLGVYSVFSAGGIVEETAIEAPVNAGVKLHHLVTKRLNGRGGSGIAHVIDGMGEAGVGRETMTAD